jgi:hypothetical protein
VPFSQVLEDELNEIRDRRLRLLKAQVRPPRTDQSPGEAARPNGQATEGQAVSATEQIAAPPPPSHESAEDAANGRERQLPQRDARRDALNDGLAGLAFSGGGIRSATFALGFLQGLAGLKLLRIFDYLSTVSGGGYAGGWLAAWIYREGNRSPQRTGSRQALEANAADSSPAVFNVERQLDPSRVEEARAVRTVSVPGEPAHPLGREVLDEEPEPIHHLRAYSNYLAPRPGLFTADTWTLFSIYLRNTFINLLLVVPAVLALVFASRLLVWGYAQDPGAPTAIAVTYRGDQTILPGATARAATPPGPWPAVLLGAILLVGFGLARHQVFLSIRRSRTPIARVLALAAALLGALAAALVTLHFWDLAITIGWELPCTMLFFACGGAADLPDRPAGSGLRAGHNAPRCDKPPGSCCVQREHRGFAGFSLGTRTSPGGLGAGPRQDHPGTTSLVDHGLVAGGLRWLPPATVAVRRRQHLLHACVVCQPSDPLLPRRLPAQGPLGRRPRARRSDAPWPGWPVVLGAGQRRGADRQCRARRG